MTRASHSALCSTREFAQQRGISRQRALALLSAGRVPGARWVAGRWAIPRSAQVAAPNGARSAGRGLARLTPLENALLADFAARVRALAGARLLRVAVFGSRVRGGSGPDSDLDVAVFLSGSENRLLRARVYAQAAEASAALDGAEPALLQPAVIFADSPRTGFVAAVERESETWTS